jgi:hypothetical protein
MRTFGGGGGPAEHNPRASTTDACAGPVVLPPTFTAERLTFAIDDPVRSSCADGYCGHVSAGRRFRGAAVPTAVQAEARCSRGRGLRVDA